MNDREALPLLVLAGPTASGKTALAVELGGQLPVEVISADSRQVYRWMDVGTAKASPAERAAVPHHLLDVVDPDEAFTAADFMRQGRAALRRIRERGRLPLLVGGTGLYIDALVNGLVAAPPADPALRAELLDAERSNGEGSLHRRLAALDPATAQRLAPRDLVRVVRALEVALRGDAPLSELTREHAARPPFCNATLIGVAVERDELYRRIDSRTAAMFSGGLVEETQALLRRGFSPDLKSLQTIGYREAVQLLSGRCDLARAVAEASQETRRYAKRQMTWFRKKNSIIWFDSAANFAKILSIAQRLHAE